MIESSRDLSTDFAPRLAEWVTKKPHIDPSVLYVLQEFLREGCLHIDPSVLYVLHEFLREGCLHIDPTLLYVTGVSERGMSTH